MITLTPFRRQNNFIIYYLFSYSTFLYVLNWVALINIFSNSFYTTALTALSSFSLLFESFFSPHIFFLLKSLKGLRNLSICWIMLIAIIIKKCEKMLLKLTMTLSTHIKKTLNLLFQPIHGGVPLATRSTYFVRSLPH